VTEGGDNMVRRTQTQPQQAMKDQQKGEDQQGQEGSTSIQSRSCATSGVLHCTRWYCTCLWVTLSRADQYHCRTSRIPHHKELAITYRAVQSSTEQYRAIQSSIEQYSTVQSSTAQYRAVHPAVLPRAAKQSPAADIQHCRQHLKCQHACQDLSRTCHKLWFIAVPAPG
jgi:hypothetical protein